jgi:hypothetical protein
MAAYRAGAEDEGRQMAGSMHEIASALLFDTTGRFLFQQRDNIEGITEPGKMGSLVGTKRPTKRSSNAFRGRCQRNSASICHWSCFSL